jgi:galactokinase
MARSVIGARAADRRSRKHMARCSIDAKHRGVRISSISRAKGIKEDTILDWLRAAARQAAEVEEALLKDYRISQAQIDGLWTYVGHKGHKGGTPNRMTGANFGAAP